MTVAELIVYLSRLPQDATLVRLQDRRLKPIDRIGHIIPAERGYYLKHPSAAPFVGEWRMRGSVVRNAENLDRVEEGKAFLVEL